MFHSQYWNRNENCYSSRSQLIPKNFSFNTTVAPYNGSTTFIINADDFSTDFQNMDLAVYVAGTKCKCSRNKLKTNKIEFVVECKPEKIGSGRIALQGFHEGYISHNTFYFVDPFVENFEPKSGPASGVTQVKISGRDFAGNYIKVHFGDTECKIIKVTESEIHCETSPTKASEIGAPLKVQFGEHIYYDASKNFTFVTDPIIKSVSSDKINIEIPEGTPNGEEQFFVEGEGFRYIQNPSFNLSDTSKNITYNGTCHVESDTEMICTKSYIGEMNKELIDNPKTLDIVFEMNRLKIDRSSEKNETFKFKLNADPVYDPILMFTLFLVLLTSIIIIVCLYYKEEIEWHVFLLTSKKRPPWNQPIKPNKSLNEEADLLQFYDEYDVPENVFKIDRQRLLGNGAYGIVWIALTKLYGDVRYVAIKEPNVNDGEVNFTGNSLCM